MKKYEIIQMTHEEKMQKAWDFIHNTGITDDKEEYEAAPESFWLVKDLYEVRDAFYDDLENGIGDDDNGLTEFFERHKIDYK